MPKPAKELKALQVKNLSAPGRHAVGGVNGLCLNITETGARSWILRVTVGLKRRHIGLGGYPEVSLAEARELALEMRRKISAGVDPVVERREQRQALVVTTKQRTTFEQAFTRFFEEKVEGELRNAKHRNQWQSTLKTYAYPVLGEKAVADISVEDVLEVLRPIWMIKNETASRVRQRIEAVLDWSKAMGLRNGENPARWKGNLQQLLSSPNKVQKDNRHPAIALDELALWFRLLRAREGIAARALEFLTLTAARSGEIRGAQWDEIDLQIGVWTVPAERMKAGREHRVPLSTATVDLLEAMPRMLNCDVVFPSPKNGVMSDMTLSAVMRRIQESEEKAGRPGFLDIRSRRPAVPHGLRSSFRDWAAERTAYPRDMAEIALAHTVGSEVERAYRRSDMLERRREMMDAWAKFILGSNPKICPTGVDVRQ
ncbi:tyrosine-type recombinase/integrase [Roseovarius sp. 217]|uniref:tyrosine-type recombinase/integrase n=1 Tax=Roseovarius sp. (strain 217) TaxID=314264 RepID=UPI00006864B5|nr:integrase arm-type DNA-binding domain-containing protein [Roseovarius sp. 217]EAQ23911.1 putative P4-family integrase [Roseovarius sp. 217]